MIGFRLTRILIGRLLICTFMVKYCGTCGTDNLYFRLRSCRNCKKVHCPACFHGNGQCATCFMVDADSLEEPKPVEYCGICGTSDLYFDLKLCKSCKRRVCGACYESGGLCATCFAYG